MPVKPGLPKAVGLRYHTRFARLWLFAFSTCSMVRMEIGLVTPLTRVTLLVVTAWLSLGIENRSSAADLPKAVELFPSETQAFVCLPNSESFLDNWGKTELGKLAADERLSDFWNSQQESIRNRLAESGWQLNVKFDDLPNICSGQAAMGWISREQTEKPYSLGVVIDVQGKESQVEELLTRIEKEMGQLKATSKTIASGSLSIRQYSLPKVQNGTRARESFYVVSQGQLLAGDDLQTIEELIAAQATPPEASLAKSELYLKARGKIRKDSHPDELEYFVRPIGFGRLLRAVSEKSARSQIDMLKLLEGQGFGSILCAAGSLQFRVEELDMHHRGFILREEEVPESVQILDFPNDENLIPPAWIDPNSASVLGFSWNFSDAFPKFRGLVDAYVGDEVFEQILSDLIADPNGPQIDIRNDVLPFIGTQFFVITQIETPITPESKRSLICVKLKDPQNKLTNVLNRYSKTEPGSSIEDIGDFRVWKFSNDEVPEETLEFDAAPGAAKPGNQNGQGAPLLEQWAVTIIDGWFVFSSSPDFLKTVIDRASQPPAENEFEKLEAVAAARAMQHKLLGSPAMSFSEIDLSDRSFEMQYELFRQNILPQSRSLLALIAERLLKTDKAQQQQLQGGKLPPYAQVKHFFTPAGMVIRTEKDGWGIDGFILGKKDE